jgi:hypothetical protein
MNSVEAVNLPMSRFNGMAQRYRNAWMAETVLPSE